jgi:hypothetical protein
VRDAEPADVLARVDWGRPGRSLRVLVDVGVIRAAPGSVRTGDGREASPSRNTTASRTRDRSASDVVGNGEAPVQ